MMILMTLNCQVKTVVAQTNIYSLYETNIYSLYEIYNNKCIHLSLQINQIKTYKKRTINHQVEEWNKKHINNQIDK
jgi:hypothetical protein